MTALSLPSTADLESLVTTAIYASLISARLSPATTPPTVNVTAVAPLRDVPPQSLPKMISLLTEWESRCGEVVSDLEAEIARVRENAAKRHANELAYQKLQEEVVKKRAAEAARTADSGVWNGRAGRRVGGRGGTRSGTGLGSHKRDADDIDQDDGLGDSGEGGEPGSRMEIDDGAGSSRGSRQIKRILGRKG